MTRYSAWLVLLLAMAGCRESIGKGWDWNRMRRQPRANALGANAALPNGMVNQHAPDGTIPFDAPSIGSAADDAGGAEQYGIYCAVCHGDRADGVSVMARNIEPPKPPSLRDGAAGALGAGAIDSVIAHGSGTMMGFGADIPAVERSAIISYITRLRAGSLNGTPP